MQHRTPSPSTQSGASVEFRAFMSVLSKQFSFYARVSFKHDNNKIPLPTDSPPQNNHRDAGFGNRSHALHAACYRKGRGNAAIPPGARSVRFRPTPS